MYQREDSSDVGKPKGTALENGLRRNVPEEIGRRKDVPNQVESREPVASATPASTERQSLDLPECSGRKSLWPFYNAVNANEYTDPEQASRLFDEILAEGLDNYTGPPDTWHNASMVAGRVRHRVAQLRLVQAGLLEWPENVDLLCDEMQYRQTTQYDPDRLAEIWDTLVSMDRRKTAPYWRFWVTGATYSALELDEPAAALRLLDEGLCSVRRAALTDILRSYRRVFVDSISMRKLRYPKQVIEQQARALEALEERYLLGIELGVENSYVLATELALLYQEKAGFKESAVEPPADATTDGGVSGRDDYLRKALDYLDLAEKLYTGNPNHPVWQIYEQRIRILMAQRRYGDAIKFLRCLPASRLADPSQTTMLNLASQMTGERIQDDASLSPERLMGNLDSILSVLLGNDGELLFRIAGQNPSVHATLLSVLQRLQ